MNRLTCGFAFLLGFLPLLSAQAQGTINFMNRVLPAGIDAPVFNVDGVTKLDGGAFVAQLYAGPSADSLAPVGATVAFMTDSRAGYFSGGTRIIPTVAPGATAFVQVRVWAIAWGSTFETAWASGGATGVSEVLNVTTGAGGIPPSVPADLTGLESFKLENPVPAFITAQPLGQEVIAGNSVTFTVAGGGTAPLSYRWRKNGLDIPGATSSTLTLENVQPADEADYRAIVQNFFGAATSETAHLSVLVPPAIAAQPESKTAVAGENVALSVAAEGTAPLSFQWRFGGADLPGKTASILALDNVQPEAAGAYSVVVTNKVGIVASAAATLAVHYRLTVNPSVGGSVSASPAQASYGPDSTVTLTATPSAGFAFLGWNGDASGAVNPLTVTMTAHKIIVANFAPIFALTTSVAGEGNVSATPAKASYIAGEVVEVTATPAAGWAFVSWSGVSSATTPTISLTMDGHKTLTANFKRLRSLTTTVSGLGTVTRSPEAMNYLDGAVAQLTATAASGWQFVGWSGALSGTASPASITMDADKSVTATFKQLFTVTTSVTGGGTVAVSPAQTNYVDGASVTLTATAAAGQRFTGWSGDLSGSANPATLVVNSSKSVTADFAAVWTLATTASAGGSVTRAPDQPDYLNDTSVTLTAVADAGYAFTRWSGDAAGASNPLTVTMDADKNISANFTPTYVLTAAVTGEGSVSVSPAKDRYLKGETVNLTAVPTAGSALVNWSGASSATTPTISLTMDSNRSVTANFKPLRTLSVVLTGQGTVTRSPDASLYLDGAVVQLTAKAASGWQFVGWTGAVNGLTDRVSLTMDADKEAGALFLELFTVSSSVEGNGTVSWESVQATYLDGTEITVHATPTSTQPFIGWSGDLSGTNTPVTLVVDGNKNFTAHFAPGWKLTTAAAAGGSLVRDPDLAEYTDGTSVTLTAKPDAGYAFGRWSGAASGTNNPVTLTMDTNKSVSASFVPTYALSTSVAGDGSVAVSPLKTSYLTGEGVTLTATPAAGWAFVNWSGASSATTATISLTMDGNKAVTANLKRLRTLAASVTGNGAVARSPDATSYLDGAVVQVTATPAAGWQFVGWSGAASGVVNPVSVTLDADKTITAAFKQLFAVSANVVGKGTVALAPAQASYLDGTTVTATATPAAGQRFLGWSGDLSGTNNPASLTVEANKSLTATFSPVWTLAASAGAGGSVTRSPELTEYLHGSVVTLSAIANDGFIFTGWTGAAAGTSNPLLVTMDGSKTISANFTATYTLAAAVKGDGSVSVVPLKDAYLAGESVQLTAVPAAGWAFVNWSGASGATTPTISLSMDENKSLTATFKAVRTLAVSISGQGSVARSPEATSYLDGAVVQLTAQAAEGWQFTGWSGAASGAVSSVNLTLDADKTVNATFKQLFAVNTKVEGNGAVTLDPAQVTYLDGTSVSVAATAAAGYRFTGWTGDLSGTNNPASLTVEANKSLTATFSPVWTLAASAGAGGSVTRSPEQTEYLHGSVVTLSAKANDGFIFTGWSGDAAGTSNPLLVTMDGSKTISANFTATYTLATFVTGDGSITLSPLKDTYLAGEVIQLTATPAAGSAFVNWSGASSATTATLSLTMDASKSVAAHFKRVRKLITSVVGQGTITRSPDKAEYLDGDVVELAATAAEGWQFAGWEGAATGSENRTSLSVNADAEAKAVFKPVAAAKLSENGFSGKLTAEKGKVYVIEVSSNFKDWMPVATVTNLTGALEFHDPSATTAGLRFYRARLVE